MFTVYFWIVLLYRLKIYQKIKLGRIGPLQKQKIKSKPDMPHQDSKSDPLIAQSILLGLTVHSSE